MSVKLLIADDHPVVREGIRRLAEPAGIDVIGHVDSSKKVVESVVKSKPSVLVTEVRLGGQDALKCLEKLNNGCRVIVFTSYLNPTNIARASALGCHDFIFKTSSCESLIKSVASAGNGNSTPENSLLNTTKARMSRASSNGNGNGKSNGSLTSRESQVIRHVSMGLSNREIGKSLGISVETVKEHVQNILRKLDVNDRTQAAIWAITNSLI